MEKPYGKKKKQYVPPLVNKFDLSEKDRFSFAGCKIDFNNVGFPSACNFTGDCQNTAGTS